MTSRKSLVADRADFISLKEAAQLSGVSVALLTRWARARWPRVIALADDDGGLRLPRWQFDPQVWVVVPDLARALRGNAWSVMAWLETPHGAFDGRTPRTALEQGEPPRRVLDIARADES